MWFRGFHLDDNSGHLITGPFLQQRSDPHWSFGFDLLEIETLSFDCESRDFEISARAA
jgi:hypothetical protein